MKDKIALTRPILKFLEPNIWEIDWNALHFKEILTLFPINFFADSIFLIFF